MDTTEEAQAREEQEVSWRMPTMCDSCPFAKSGKGRALAKTLRPGRLAEIKRGLRGGERFLCHKTTDETGDGSKLVCAGALEYQEKQGVSSNYQRVMERLEGFESHRDRESGAGGEGLVALLRRGHLLRVIQHRTE